MSLSVNIQKRYKNFALDVQFSSNGQPLAILGASGSGKSLTLKCIAGIETPDEGHIELNGRVLFSSSQGVNLRPQQRGVGYLFQSYALFPHMTVEENIACALRGKRAAKAPRIAALLQRYQLQGFEKRYPGQLSGGQQQRVALARIFAYQPGALLLDEPFSALDSHLKEALQVEMIGLLAQYQGDAVMVTHSRDEAYKLCANTLILESGRAVAFGDTKAMFRHPTHLAQARLTGCKNFSRAVALSPTRVDALDWGVQLDVAGPVPPGLSHIGVRAHSFFPAETGMQNAIPARISQRVESPFEWDVLFQNAGQKPGASIWWKVPKGTPIPETPPALSVKPEDVLLLTE